MTRLQMFKDKLRENGFSVITNWETENHTGKVQHCTIHGGEGFIMVIFHEYKGNNGYDMYVQSAGNDMEADLNNFKDTLH